MVVGAAGHQLHAAGLQLSRHGLCILHDLARIFLEFRLQCLPEADGLCRDDMLQRAALGAGEDGGIDPLGQHRVVGQDQAAARAAQGLVGRGGHNVCIGHRALVIAARHQTGDVGHIDHQVSAIAVGDLGQLFKVDGAGVSRRARHDELRAHRFDLLFQRRIVDDAVLVDAVGNEVVVLAGHVHRRAVGQVATLRQVHAHDGIADVQQCKVDGQVGLCTGVRLHVGILGPKQLAGALNGDVLDLIHIGTAAVIALARQTLGILVGQHRAHRSHHGRRNDVLAGDQLDVLPLAGQLAAHRRSQLRVSLAHQTDGIQHFIVHFYYPSLTDRSGRSGSEVSLAPLFFMITKSALIRNHIFA